MNIVTLMENTACREELACEHGLSLYLEVHGRKLLFDAGQSGGFAENAHALGVDLAAVDAMILSHGHYDHGGGIRRFLEINHHAPVYVSRYAFQAHFNAAGKDIGLDPALQKHPRLVAVDGRLDLGDGLTIETLDSLPEDTAGLTMAPEGTPVPEDFRHEQYLLIREGQRRFLISGCSHKGIRSIARAFRPDVLVGGFHFMKVEDTAFLRQAAQELLTFAGQYYTGHCTGQQQFAVMAAIMGSRVRYLSAGTCVTIA